MSMSGTHLITGGAGFVGSSLARGLSNGDGEVLIVDDLSTGSRLNLPDEAIFIEANLCDDFLYDRLSDYDVDFVHHLAAQSSGEKSFDDPVTDFRSNVEGTFKLLNWSLTQNVTQFLFASSMSVYGSPMYLPVDEDHRVSPKSYYAAGKLAAESYVRLHANLGLNTTIFRLFSVYGPGQNMRNMKQGMVSIYLAFILNDDKLIVKGSTDRFRDFVFIDDVVDAWIMTTGEPNSFDETYNVACSEKIEISELIDTILSTNGTPEYPIQVQEGTPGDQFGIYGDASKLEYDTGWKPAHTIQSGIKRMIAAEKQN
jgi:UDP-glucose 4-epimerase